MKKLNAIGAYVFGGGFSSGIAPRFKIIRHLADTDYGVSTLRLNFPRVPIDVGMENWHGNLYRGTGVDLVYGNPPCAAWSALKGARRFVDLADDPRVDCTRRLFTLLETVCPTVWVWESVDQAFTIGRAFVDGLTLRALTMGYSVTHLRFDAQYHGCFHVRKRYFMIVHRTEFKWEQWVRFAPAPYVAEVLEPYENTRDHGLALSTGHAKLWRATRPGGALATTFNRLYPENGRTIRTTTAGMRITVGRPAFSVYRLAPDRVCRTVVGNNLLHYNQPRRLSIQETLRLCGYPSDWQFGIQGGGRFNLLARAVMPPIGRWLGGLVRQSINLGSRPTEPTATIINLRDGANVVKTIWRKK